MNLSARHTVTDQMGRSVAVPPEPQRIISLVPAQTELLFDLGLEAETAGRTKFCVRPADKAAQIPSVAGANQFRFDLIDWLQPDLIIGDKEENYQEGIERIIMVDDICHGIFVTFFLLLSFSCDKIRATLFFEIGETYAHTNDQQRSGRDVPKDHRRIGRRPFPHCHRPRRRTPGRVACIGQRDDEAAGGTKVGGP